MPTPRCCCCARTGSVSRAGTRRSPRPHRPARRSAPSWSGARWSRPGNWRSCQPQHSSGPPSRRSTASSRAGARDQAPGRERPSWPRLLCPAGERHGLPARRPWPQRTPATVSRSRSLSQSRDSQDLAGPAPRGRRQAGPGGAYRAHCIDLPYRGRALIACAHASAAPAYFTVPPWQKRTPHSSEGWLAR